MLEATSSWPSLDGGGGCGSTHPGPCSRRACRCGRATACGCCPRGRAREPRPGRPRTGPRRGARGVGDVRRRRGDGVDHVCPLPADVFYNVTGTGFRAGASRVLVLLGWPISLAAVALVAVAADRFLASAPPRRRAPGGDRRGPRATLLCATIAWPGVIDESDLDAKQSNGLAAVGVGIALLLTVAAAAGPASGARRTGRATARRVILIALLRSPGSLDPRERRVLRGRHPGPQEHLHVQADPARARPSGPPRRPPRKPRGHRRHPARRDRVALRPCCRRCGPRACAASSGSTSRCSSPTGSSSR